MCFSFLHCLYLVSFLWLVDLDFWNSDSLYIERYVEVFSPKPVFPMKNVPVIYLGNRCLFLDILGALQVLVGWALEGSSLHPSLLLIDLYLSELCSAWCPHIWSLPGSIPPGDVQLLTR